MSAPENRLEDSPFEMVLDHYSVLEVAPHASPSEIREAYFRLKMTYQKDSAALYTLIDDSEREEMLKKVEDAYSVLSHPDRRREYDASHERIESAPETLPTKTAKIISIDRVPPMEDSSAEDLLIPPRTDYPEMQQQTATPPPTLPASTTQTPAASLSSSINARTAAPAHTAASPALQRQARESYSGGLTPEFLDEIKEQKEWSGEFLKRVREANSVSIHDLSSVTRITRNYISAIEEEDYAKLPAAVFVRGFVSQIARHLKLPSQEVASAYMARYQRLRPES